MHLKIYILFQMESESPAQLPVVQETKARPPPGQPVISQQQQVSAGQPGQPITYQMPPGQPQPVFIQVPAGRPATTPERQPIQYYHAPVGPPLQPGQQVSAHGATGQPVQPGQPMYVQGATGQPVQPRQPVYVQGATGEPVQSGQPVYVLSATGEPVQLAGQGGFELNIDTEFLKSPRCFIKIAEFVSTAAVVSFL